MLPDSNFPITGGIMQTEEVVPRATSVGIDSGTPIDRDASNHRIIRNESNRRTELDSSSLVHPDFVTPSSNNSTSTQMAVKQEPREDDDRDQGRSCTSPQADSHTVQSVLLADGGPGQIQAQPQPTTGRRGDAQPGQETGGRPRPSRRRRKSRWKLKFHHQALPPEYLDHYEAALAQEALNSPPTPAPGETMPPSPAPTTSASTPSPVGDVQSWLQRIAAMQQELCPGPQSPQSLSPFVNPSQGSIGLRRSVITSTPNVHPHPQHPHQNGHHRGSNGNSHQQHVAQSQPIPRPPMKYSDLPYMGEITLDNSKPRRGRKPKKADICHLIYKNYGTILPGTPGLEERKQTLGKVKTENRTDQQQQQTMSFQRTDIQNRISSLLEKRLTQESRRNLNSGENPVKSNDNQEEPLNLCIRDLNQLKIRLLRKHGNVYESGNVKSEASSDGEEVECLGTTSPLGITEHPRLLDGVAAIQGVTNINNNTLPDPMAGPNPGFVYWPNAGVFVHPVALQSQLLYYQKMAQAEAKEHAKGVPKSIYSMLDEESSTRSTTPNPRQSPNPGTPTTSPATPEPPRTKRNAPIGGPPHGQPTKRKRSAIFIPPMPTENNNNPATEVSICKFKFTGGAKPSLQEKKSLSVDSGGNFRYYSGTGDKSMRGYEFFPRESLQQPAGQAGSSAGAFLNAAGERIPPTGQRASNPEDGRRKRKTRKSLQREKLEQTFKEKGFLIQTQQLESAEGATYCKFRQLRKFTRYLFRSWKDYLPGNVRELTGGVEGEGENETDAVEGDLEGDAHTAGNGLPTSLVDLPGAILDEARSMPQSLPLT